MKSYIYNSRLVGALLFSLNLSLALSSCDTTEEGYHVGTLSDVYLTTDPATQLRVPADGQPREIAVSSNVDWEIEDLEGVFSATASDRHGDGTITVSAGLNVNSEQVRTATLRIYARDFDKSITIDLIQARMNFSMNSQEFTEAPEQGMTYNLSFNSSIDWRFNVSEGEIGWLDFNPGSTGGGDWNEIEVAATMQPNYTTEPRSITMQLYPSDASLLEYVTLPPRFTITQAAGTLPSDITLSSNGEPTYYTIPLTIAYKSNAPIDELGVIIAGSGQRFVAPLQQGASYPQNGNYSFTLEGLEQNTLYTLTPFVRSKVGETLGSQIQIYTDGDGPQLVNYTINPSAYDVAASFNFQYDFPIQSVTVQLRDTSDALIAEQTETVNASNATLIWSQNVTLQPNRDYTFTVSAVLVKPNSQNIETYTLATIPFKTLNRTPQEGDNTPID